MDSEQLDQLLKKGIKAAEKGSITSAQVFLGQVAKQRKTPELQTYLAYCSAKGQGMIQAAINICRESIQRDPGNSLHYLILGRILLLAGEKQPAIESFRQGLRVSKNPLIIDELKKLGIRKPAVLTSLKRNHPLNRILGKFLCAIGYR